MIQALPDENTEIDKIEKGVIWGKSAGRKFPKHTHNQIEDRFLGMEMTEYERSLIEKKKIVNIEVSNDVVELANQVIIDYLKDQKKELSKRIKDLKKELK